MSFLNKILSWLRGDSKERPLPQEIANPPPPAAGAIENPAIIPEVVDIMAPYNWTMKEVGNKEIPGNRNNLRIVWYHSFTGLHATDDETAWCSALMCAAAESNGFKSTRSAAAKSWIPYGDMGDGSVGDIVVFKRTGGNHVAFVAAKYKKGDKYIYCLGGNQNNQVGYQYYAADKLITFRRFSKSTHTLGSSKLLT